ncbi:MAG: fumarylacetoacetate hydrolase family protein [Burkholderiales bacterium]|nr:fumarylacetoacetate hydrolase family protein [Burkholderiales bacterium]
MRRRRLHSGTSIRRFRPDNPLLPNDKRVPIGYHGRASSVIASGRPFVRPTGQLKGPQDEPPRLAPTERLDFELEIGVIIGRGNPLGAPVPIGEAESHVFGLTLFNAWSARDIQAWEYQPLGLRIVEPARVRARARKARRPCAAGVGPRALRSRGLSRKPFQGCQRETAFGVCTERFPARA